MKNTQTQLQIKIYLARWKKVICSFKFIFDYIDILEVHLFCNYDSGWQPQFVEKNLQFSVLLWFQKLHF